jgi:predicted site-specific integrase-resolvase
MPIASAAPDLLADGELTPRAVAERLGVSVAVVHGWLSAGTLSAWRSPTGRWCIPFPPEVEAACRDRIATSPHLHRDADGLDRQPGELSVAEVASRLNVKPDVVYYWAERGYLPNRRGKGGRRWVAFAAQTEADCRARVARSYKLPEHVKAAHRRERIAV